LKKKIPSARNLGVVNYLELNIKNNDELASEFNEGLRYINNLLKPDPNLILNKNSKDFIKIIKSLELEIPKFFENLLRQTYMIYYSQGAIRVHFGLSSNAPHPDGYQIDNETQEELSKLVKPVLERGHCYLDIK